MSKPAIARLFLGGVAAVAIGLVLGAASIAAGQAVGVYVGDDGGFGGHRVAPLGAIVVGLASGSAIALVGGALALLVAWAAALANARSTARQGWFVSLLLLGLPTCGVAALVAYLLAGPDPRPARA